MKTLIIKDSFTAQKASYERFAELQNTIETCDDNDLALYLHMENRVGYSFIFLFTTLPYLAEKYDKRIKIFCNNKNYNLFKKLRFLDEGVGFAPDFDYTHALKKKAGLITEDAHIFRTVTVIPNEAPVKMSPDLASIFISRAGEMYNNALEHSKGNVLGAKYFRNQKNTYCFSCYDDGIGIPCNVMSLKKDLTSQVDAFRWAMIDGNSTVNDGIPRGLGLGLLKSFVRANEGSIRISSGNVLYTYKKNDTEKYYALKNRFHGTLFEMDIIADNDRKYILT